MTSRGIQKESYRNPHGLRAESRRSPGRGMGRGVSKGRWERDAERAELRRTEELAAQAEREVRLRPRIDASGQADQAWADARSALELSLPASSFRLWLEPLRCLGEVDNALCLEAPSALFEWVRRHYTTLIGDAVRDQGEYRGAFLFQGEEQPAEGLL